MRVEEGRNCWNLRAIKKKACAVMGKGEKNLCSDRGSELRLEGGGKEI